MENASVILEEEQEDFKGEPRSADIGRAFLDLILFPDTAATILAGDQISLFILFVLPTGLKGRPVVRVAYYFVACYAWSLLVETTPKLGTTPSSSFFFFSPLSSALRAIHRRQPRNYFPHEMVHARERMMQNRALYVFFFPQSFHISSFFLLCSRSCDVSRIKS